MNYTSNSTFIDLLFSTRLSAPIDYTVIPPVPLRAAIIVVLLGTWRAPALAEPFIEDVQAIYTNRCADCHESDGRGAEYRSSGTSIPDFTSADWMRRRSPTQLKLSILLGKGEEMPPFEGEMTDAETVALVSFIRAMSGLSTGGGVGTHSRARFDRELAQLNREWDRLRMEWNRVFTDFETTLVNAPTRSRPASLRDVK